MYGSAPVRASCGYSNPQPSAVTHEKTWSSQNDRPMAATIKQVAALADVSTATVSYVLNGTGTVTEATRQRVLDVVTRLNYQPSHAARSMRGRSYTLGLTLPAL